MHLGHTQHHNTKFCFMVKNVFMSTPPKLFGEYRIWHAGSTDKQVYWAAFDLNDRIVKTYSMQFVVENMNFHWAST